MKNYDEEGGGDILETRSKIKNNIANNPSIYIK